MSDLLYKWQELAGAIIGAATPVSLLLITGLYKKRKSRLEYLQKLEKYFVYQINRITDIRKTIKRFLDNHLAALLRNVGASSSTGVYSVDTAFFPLFSNPISDDEILKGDSKSNYIENNVAQAHQLMADFGKAMDDVRHQFNYSTEFYRNLALQKVNPYYVQNQQYYDNLQEFKRMVEEDVLSKNIPICLKQLAYVRTAVDIMRRIGFPVWYIKFSPSFRYFRNKEKYKQYISSGPDRVEAFIKQEAEKFLAEIEKDLG